MISPQKQLGESHLVIDDHCNIEEYEGADECDHDLVDDNAMLYSVDEPTETDKT